MWCLETIKKLNEAAAKRHEVNENVSLAFRDVGINSKVKKNNLKPKSLDDLVCVTKCKSSFWND